MSFSSLATRVIKSVFFRNAQSKAYRYANNRRKLSELLGDVYEKSKKLDGKEQYAQFLASLGTLRRMVRAYKQGEYREVPWRTIGLIIAALIYFVSPLDFIPDVLPLLGFTDDIALILWVYNAAKSDIEKFRVWEANQFTPLNESE